MDLFKWTSKIKPEFPNGVEKFFRTNIEEKKNPLEHIATVPSVNTSDNKKAFEVSVAVPGLDKKYVQFEISNDCLINSSEKTFNKEENDSHWMRKDYGYASFQRMFRSPKNADPDQVEAKTNNGFLTIKMAKREGPESKPKKLLVKYKKEVLWNYWHWA